MGQAFDRTVALITALATVTAVFFAWRAARAAKDSVDVAQKAAAAGEKAATAGERAATRWRAIGHGGAPGAAGGAGSPTNPAVAESR